MARSDTNRALIVGFAAVALSMAMVTMHRTAGNRAVVSSCRGTVVSEPATFGDDIKRCLPAAHFAPDPIN
jgi:hypothetical protein